jgi:PAS domain S-box-containing protein
MNNEIETVETQEDLQLQIKKLKRLLALQEKQISRAELVSTTRSKVVDMLKAERLAQSIQIKQTRDEIAERNEFIRILFDNAPIGLTVFDEDFKFVDCNDAVLEMYGVTKEEYSTFFGSELHSPELQPDGSNSREKAMEVVKRIMTGETMRIEWLHLTPAGKPLPVDLTMMRVIQDGKYIGLGYIYDLNEQKLMMDAIKNRDEMLQAVNKAAAFLLNTDIESFDNDLFEAMNVIGKAVNVDRMYIWENHKIDGKLHCTQVHEWSEGADPLQGSEITLNKAYSKIMPSDWVRKLKKGECINGIVRDMPKAAQAHLSSQGIVSMITAPIFLDNHFWGFIGFDDCFKERIFTEEEESTLRSCGLLFANAVLRNQMLQKMRDTSARLELALNQTEEQQRIIISNHENLQTILNMLPVGVRIMRISDGALLYANEASLKVFDCDSFEDQVQGRSGMDFMPEYQPDGRKTVDLVGELFKQDSFSAEMQCLKMNGKPFTARIISHTTNYKGDLASLAVIEDVTAEKEYQRTLQNIATIERKANQAKSNFLSNMSHEIRTPLNAIVGMTTVGKRADELDGKNHALSKIEEASSHLLGIINDVLDMAKIEADKLELVPTEFDFNKMLHKVLTVVNHSVDEKRQELIVNIDDNIPRFLVGDDQRLAQVLANLLANAVKFTHEGGKVHLDAFIIGETESVYELRIEVTDSGIGMSYEQQLKLFDAFEQADKSTSREYGGTGLGLAISKRIVELMGGTIWVESKLGEGAKFIFTMRVERSIRNDAAYEEHDSTDDDTDINVIVSDVTKGKHMLVAEDIEINREIIIALLEETGIIIDCAKTGREALDMIMENPEKYDIVFMDVQMPQMDGLEATRFIRVFLEEGSLNSHRSDRLPIIAMTANVFKGDIEDCIEAGMDDHLGKPLDIDRVMEVLLKHLRK